jgi:hypothetical protein
MHTGLSFQRSPMLIFVPGARASSSGSAAIADVVTGVGPDIAGVPMVLLTTFPISNARFITDSQSWEFCFALSILFDGAACKSNR